MINNIDFLSPPITLFHLEKRTHTSKVGGFLVLVMVGLCSAYIGYLLYNLIGHKKLTSLFHKKFEFEAGYYSFNSSSIFHFIQIFSPESGGYFDKYDSKYIRAFTTYVHSNFTYANLHLYDHWVFDTCRKDIDDKDLEPYLFENVENFTNGVCIRHYYNSTEKKYYNLEDKGFFWPHLEHGISQRNNIYLTTIIQKCTNDSVMNKIFGQCPSQKEIDDYVSRYFGIYLYFTDTQVDPSNYTMPVQKYLQTISTGIGTPQTFVESYIHYSPLRVRTKLGSLFEEYSDINSFYFDFNRKGSANNNEKYFTITKYYHLMQNNVQIYERKYNNIFDLFSEIGGVIQFIFYFFYWANYFYNKYIIAYDTNSLFFSIKDNQTNTNEISNDNNTPNKTNRPKKIFFDIQHHIKIPDKSIKKKLNIFTNLNNNKENNNNYDKSFNKIIINDELERESDNKKDKTKLETNNKKIKDNNIDYINLINDNKDKKDNKDIERKDTPIKEINKSNTYYNSSNFFLKENKNNFIRKINKENYSFIELYKKIDLNKVNDNKTISNKDYIKKIFVSRGGISKIDHIKRESGKVYDENLRHIKYFTVLDFIKSLLFKREKESHNFLRIFRKHLLSEEHLLKTHLKIIFLEKAHNFTGKENINVLKCFDEL